MSGLKRKRAGAETSESVTTAKVVVLEASSSKLGPVLAHFPSLAPPEKTPAYIYGSNARAIDKTKGSSILVAETPQIEYVSTNQDQAADGTGYTCQYLVAVHDRKNNTVTFRPAPLYDLTRTVKALKNIEPQAVSQAQRAQARNVLGEAFGTKKAKAAIRAAERNRVDVAAMKDVQDFVVESVRDGTSALPTKGQTFLILFVIGHLSSLTDEVVEASLSTRLIPTPNTAATTPAEAYPLSNIVPSSELESISIQPFISASTSQERRALLPFRHSTWLNHRLTQMFVANESISKTKLKSLIYASILLAFRNTAGFTLSKANTDPRAALREKLDSAMVPDSVFDGFMERFTETARGGRPAVTGQTETKLFTYFLALCLRIDSYSVLIGTLATDLKLTPAKLATYFKSLGCKVQGTGDEKRAVLTVPLTFPKPKSPLKRGGK
ncbi:DNA-directed RNA polymerase I subunit rpa49 [Ceratobasidium sp. 395]|nr:DNA-directed RNA polymerase I subunit rpa49 [Ceratobasidium sp. 395]